MAQSFDGDELLRGAQQYQPSDYERQIWAQQMTNRVPSRIDHFLLSNSLAGSAMINDATNAVEQVQPRPLDPTDDSVFEEWVKIGGDRTLEEFCGISDV